MEWFAHRGSGKGPLENTLEAFEEARLAGFDRVEFDVQVSADGVPFIHHDWVLGRCIQRLPPEWSNGGPASTVLFNQLTSAQIEQSRVGERKVPRLAEVLNWCVQHAVRANIELKAQNPQDARRVGDAVASAVLDLPGASRALALSMWVFSSFYHASLLPLQSRLNSPRLALLYEQLPDDWAVHARALGVEAVHLHWSGADAVAVRRLHTAGLGVRVYTVNEPEQAAQLQALGVQGIFTDRMGLPGHPF